ncbi:sulfite exporter TauE/SafE family protein [soil metagenome]
MIAGLDPWVLVAIAAGVLTGAIVQGVVGLGLNLLTAPVVTLVAPELVPVVPLWLALVYPLGALRREWQDADFAGMRWALGGRVPGTAVGVLVVAWASDRVLGVSVGLMVLLAVLLTWRAVRVPVTAGSLTSAGFVAGVTGTATSIGGPPLAIVYQHHEAAEIRATMAVFFAAGALLSLLGLGAGGQLGLPDLYVALLLTPVLVAGHLLSVLLRPRLDPGHTRAAVLTICALSGAVLLVRSLAG